MGVPVYIGAEAVFSPLGGTASSNYERVLRGQSGIALREGGGWKDSDVYVSGIPGLHHENKFSAILEATLPEVLRGWDPALLSSPATLLIISSTKGDIEEDIRDPFNGVVSELVKRHSLANRPLVISNACISGVLAVNRAARLIRAGLYRHVVVLGADVLSAFVLYGFQALYAVSDSPCRPFDLNRKGVSLGEGGGGVVLSAEKSSFAESPLLYLGGADANDANHISGPSRTGEGLVRAVTKAIANAGVAVTEVGYINAHGTGTSFNDEMEAIAFNRLGLEETPLNSLKGYWGHTLGAAGVMETALCMQALRKGTAPASLGYEVRGTSRELDILTENRPLSAGVILKTASGFGGGNAALLIRKL